MDACLFSQRFGVAINQLDIQLKYRSVFGNVENVHNSVEYVYLRRESRSKQKGTEEN
jgi:hypothetical protein